MREKTVNSAVNIVKNAAGTNLGDLRDTMSLGLEDFSIFRVSEPRRCDV
jgi:hypothetical protein